MTLCLILSNAETMYLRRHLFSGKHFTISFPLIRVSAIAYEKPEGEMVFGNI